MNISDLEKRLLARHVKPTALRLLILNEMLTQNVALSLTDLEVKLETVDKSTLSRTLTLFHERLLIHSIDDGSGAMKYSVCREDCTCGINDLHIHFFCYGCKKTVCLDEIAIPGVSLPKGFLLQSVNFVMKGLCDECGKKQISFSE